MLKKLLASLLLVMLAVLPAQAQLNLTYTTFLPGQTISSAQFTANFTAISSNALNRTGGTMTGTFTANAAVDINSTFTIGSGNVQPFDSTGKIQAINSTYFANLSGANLTGLVEANITDGAILARVASPETISGAWTFSTAPTLSGANISAASIPETSIADGSVYPRNAATETISGAWTFSTAPSLSGANITAGTIAETSIANGSTYTRIADAETVSGAWNFTNGITVASLSCTNCITATQLNSTTVTAGTYGTGSAVPVITVDGDGRVTSLTTTALTPNLSGYTQAAAAETITGGWTFNSNVTINPVPGSSGTSTFTLQAVELKAGADAVTDNARWYVSGNAFGASYAAIYATIRENNVNYTQVFEIQPGTALTQGLIPFTDNSVNIGHPSFRYGNIFLALVPNNAPSYVVVNNSANPSGLSYIAAGDRTITVSGCTITVKAGLITNATGC